MPYFVFGLRTHWEFEAGRAGDDQQTRIRSLWLLGPNVGVPWCLLRHSSLAINRRALRTRPVASTPLRPPSVGRFTRRSG